MKNNTTIKAYHFEDEDENSKLRVKINKEYCWYIPETLRSEHIQKGDVVLVPAGAKTRPVIVTEVLDEDDELAKQKYKSVTEKTNRRIDIDIDRIMARKAINRKAMERQREIKAAKKVAKKLRLEEAAVRAAAKKAEKAANSASEKPKKASAAKSAANKPAKDNQFDRIKAHLYNKISKSPQDSEKSSMRQKIYDEYTNWLNARQQEIGNGALKYADAAEEIAKMTGVRIGKKTEK